MDRVILWELSRRQDAARGGKAGPLGCVRMLAKFQMIWWRIIIPLGLVMAFSLRVSDVCAQAPPDLTAISQQLLSMYPTAKATADGTDLEAAGAVLVLQKDDLIMDRVQMTPMPNVYKGGIIASEGVLGALGRFNAHNLPQQSADAHIHDNRPFGIGEKFWATAIQVSADGLYFFLMSDPIQNQRYHARLKFVFPKGATMTPDTVVGLVSEVLKVDAGADAANGSQEQAALDQVAHAHQTSAAPSETKTIAIGQTRDQVIAEFGVPTKIVQLGAKEIDYFADMKVTFVNSKVTDVK